jgi:hypothetical protein
MACLASCCLARVGRNGHAVGFAGAADRSGSAEGQGGTERKRDHRGALRRSRGGYGTKACVIVAGAGRAVAVQVAPGKAHESPHTVPLPEKLSGVPHRVMADRGYSSPALREPRLPRAPPSASKSGTPAQSLPFRSSATKCNSPARSRSTTTATSWSAFGQADLEPPGLRGGEGRSPRGRGSPRRAGAGRARSGSIPAWAGEPPWSACGKVSSRVDPRVGGGASKPSARKLCAMGRSPRGRGSLGAGFGAALLGGSIPAWAGEPHLPRDHAASPRVDPRVGGGAALDTTQFIGGLGRSPRGRGSPTTRRAAGGLAGSIPAWAGEPRRSLRRA